MKRGPILVAALAVMVSFAATAPAHACTSRIDRREFRQRERIMGGVRSGALTPREARRLRFGERRIDRMEWRAERDGRLSVREHARVNRALDRESRAIWRLKHNRRSV
jgi:hypothetical protein